MNFNSNSLVTIECTRIYYNWPMCYGHRWQFM